MSAVDLDVLMAPPIFCALVHLDAQTMDEWLLTAESFIKFQVRRDGAEGVGSEPMKKNLLKILNRRTDPQQLRDMMDELISDTVNYIRYTLWSSELYVLHNTELKDRIILNARSALDNVKMQSLAADETDN